MLSSLPSTQELFRFHYPAEIGKKEFHAVLDNVPFVPGLPECIIELKRLGGELIVISDANSYFIRHVLQHHKLLKHFNEIFSNPGYIDNQGQLIISPYMNNLECKLSSRNLCKGKVLQDYVKRRKSEGQPFVFVGFAGDGKVKNENPPTRRSNWINLSSSIVFQVSMIFVQCIR